MSQISPVHFGPQPEWANSKCVGLTRLLALEVNINGILGLKKIHVQNWTHDQKSVTLMHLIPDFDVSKPKILFQDGS